MPKWTNSINRVMRRFVKKSSGCWVWQGTINSGGYGQTSINKKSHLAHRLVYEALVGPIPDGLQLDHLCRNRSCVNPTHLEPVTAKTNLLRGNGVMAINARKTHCLRGHPFAESNLYASNLGKRICATCNRDRARGNRKHRREYLRRWRARKKAKSLV